MNIIGIDIGTYSIKIAEVTPTSSGGTLTNYSEYKLSSDPGTDRRLEIIDTLRNFTSNFNHEDTQFCVALHQTYVTHRRLSFPFKERYSIQRSLPFELEDNIPLSLDKALFDAKILSYEGHQTNVLATATSQDHIQELLDLCHDAQFEPHLMSTESLAYANLFEDWNDPPIEREPKEEASDIPTKQEAGILLHIGHNHSQLFVYSKKELYSLRSFHWGSRYISEAISRKYQLPPKEASKELENKGFILLQDDGATNDQIVFSNTIREAFESLTHALNLTFVEIESEFNLEITKCSVSGGVAGIKNIGAFLTQKLEVATNPLSIHPKHISYRSAHFSENTGGVALGLAIEGLKKPRNPAINFLKGPFAKQNKFIEVLWEKWGYTLKVATASFFVLCAYSCTRDDFALQMSERTYDSVITQAKKIVPDVKRVGIIQQTKRFIRSQNRKEKNAKIVAQLELINSPLDIVKAISNAAPSHRLGAIDVRNLKVNSETVQLEGLTNSLKAKAAFEKALTGMALNGRLKKTTPRIKLKPNETAFAYEFKVNRTKGSF